MYLVKGFTIAGFNDQVLYLLMNSSAILTNETAMRYANIPRFDFIAICSHLITLNTHEFLHDL